jgi:uncharacterized protein (DUF58 family)
MLLSPPELRALDRVSLRARRAFTGASKGEKRSTRRGSSVEFADFRAYNFGDDLRRVDWNAFGRFDKMFLKLFLEEEDLDISLLIDASASMTFGEAHKWQAARRIAACLGYVALTHFDRASGAAFDSSARSFLPPARGRASVPTLLRWCEDLPPGAAGVPSNFALSARTFALRAARPGLAFVMSDFLFEEGFETGLKTLLARGFDVVALQILDREDLAPALAGDWKLQDVESGSEREVSISASLLRTYKKNLDEHTSGLRSFCLRYGMSYVLVPADTPPLDVVLRLLRPTGAVA